MAEPIIAGPLTSLAFCWRLERRDGAGVALTSHDRALVRDGVRYSPAPGMIPAAIVRRGGLDAPSSEIHGVMSDEALTDDDLELGRWDSASIRLIAVDWAAPLAEAVPLLQGEIGTVGTVDDGFSAELTGAAAGLDAPVCPETSSECRAALGDRDCRIDLGPRRMIAVLSGPIEGNRLTMTPLPDGDYVAGSLAVVSGPMTGFRSFILGIEGGAVLLRDPPRGTIGAGTRLWLTQGCDKRFQTCRDRFANAINFRGEPHLPGNDLLTRYPGA